MIKTRVILHIPPWGFTDGQRIDVEFIQKKSNNLYARTRGEGQALQFVIENMDMSTNFHKAWHDGTFIKHVTNYKLGHFELRWVPEGKSLKIVDYDADMERQEIYDGLEVLDKMVEQMTVKTK